MRHPGSVRDDGNAQDREASAHADGAAGQPPTRAERWSERESLTHTDKPKTATPSTS
jgi:hypothetical protein